MIDRRKVAPLIRVVQEAGKRFDRILPARRWNSVRARYQLPSGAASSLFALPTGSRPADSDEVVQQAQAILKGDWTVFGNAVRVRNTPEWRKHPLSGVETSLEHFTRIPFTGDHLGGDVKYIWEINRHAELVRLAQGYFLTRDNRFAEYAVRLIDDWIEVNPPWLGVNWVSALEVAFRSIAWCWTWHLTSSSSAWTERRFDRMLWCLEHAARYLTRFDSIHHSPNTHLTGEALGLLYIGATFPQLRSAAKWRQRGVDILTAEVPHQFLDDGFHFERATGYHRYNVEFYLHALAIARSAGESWGELFVPHLERALHCSQVLRKPSGDWPVIGDEDGGATVRLWASSPRNQNPLLALGSALLNAPGLLDGVHPADEGIVWWFGAMLPARPGVSSPGDTSFVLKHAGYAGVHATIQNVPWYCIVDAGPHGGDRTGHAHTDVGHVELSVGTTDVIADAGCSVYASDTLRRNWFRSLEAHACVQVDGENLAEPRGPFGWRTTAPSPTWDTADLPNGWVCRLRYPVGLHVVHERQVVVAHNYGVLVVDFLSGSGTHAVRWRWPLGAEFAGVLAVKEGNRTELPLGQLILAWEGSGPVTVHEAKSHRSPTFGVETPIRIVELSHESMTLPASMVTSMRNTDAAAPIVQSTGNALHIDIQGFGVIRCTSDRLPDIDPESAIAAIGGA